MLNVISVQYIFRICLLKAPCNLQNTQHNSLRIWSIWKYRKISFFYANEPLHSELRSELCANLRKSHPALVYYLLLEFFTLEDVKEVLDLRIASIIKSFILSLFFMFLLTFCLLLCFVACLFLLLLKIMCNVFVWNKKTC